ncbi:MAG: YgiQ family radical SAM protein [Thermodesulfobacteriota bacterium]
MFLPATKVELKKLGWKELDVILVTGDGYIDSPFVGVAVIGKVLLDAGFKVGVIAQPDIESARDITRLGEPRLFWGVTAGCIDSLVANRTATNRKRKRCDYTPGGVNDRRPDRAAIIYANLIKKNFKNTAPIVLGGIEASLRRIAHYDFWTDKVRRSILFDAKADYILYGMAEKSVVELAEALKSGADPKKIRGLCYASTETPPGALVLPSYKEAASNKVAFTKMFKTFYDNNDPITAKTLAQKHDTRYLIENPPQLNPSTKELDRIYSLKYERALHPHCAHLGPARALETIRFSISTHRGCYAECSFCAIAIHEGRSVSSRSKSSIVAEAKLLAGHPDFKGTIHDVGGPTANMYGTSCEKMTKSGGCKEKKCLMPEPCKTLDLDHASQRALLKELRAVKGIKKVVVASGLRYDMVMADKKNGMGYLEDLVRHHVSGQMKLAPEHSEIKVLKMMNKPGADSLLKFRDLFFKYTKKAGLKQYLTYYLIAAHPGSTEKDMAALRKFAKTKLGLLPEQVQVFTPTPSTYSTLAYYTERDPATDEPCFVEKSEKGRVRQKDIIIKR